MWKVRGIPDNPAAWLMTTAKNRALDVVRRERTARTFAPELARLLEAGWTLAPVVEEAFAAPAIRDEQLRMMFSCCHPRLAEDVQVALILNILCGFGAPEIAAAFLASRAAMEKRMSRGKKVLAQRGRLFDLSDAEFAARLSAVRRGAVPAVQRGLSRRRGRIRRARRAVRGGDPPGRAAARVPGRGHAGDRRAGGADVACTPRGCRRGSMPRATSIRCSSRIDRDGTADLIEQGLALLERSAAGSTADAVSRRSGDRRGARQRADSGRDRLGAIVSLYDRLMAIAPSPVVALNRAIAVAQRDGPEAGLDALTAIDDAGRLARYPFYAAARGELELRCGRPDAARTQFAAALALARNPAERRFLEKRLAACAP